MLQVSREQTDALRASATERYVADVGARLRHRYPEALSGQDDAALSQLVREGIASARRFGVTGKRDVESFLDFVARYGAGFPAGQAWAERVLLDPDSDGAAKMARLDLWELWQRGQ